MKIRNRIFKNFKKRAVCLCTALSVLMSFPTAITAEELEQTASIDADEVVIYNNATENGPVAYFNNITVPETVVRVYDSDKGGNLLGEAKQNSILNIAYVPLSSLNTGTGVAYATRQEPGMEESERVGIRYSAARTPKVKYQFNLISNPTSGMSDDTFRGNEVKQLTAGQYYQIRVLLSDFDKISGFILPIKYDTDYLELIGLRSEDGDYYLNGPVSESDPETLEGVNFEFGRDDSYRFGVLTGDNFGSWGGSYATMASPGPDPDTGLGSSYRGEYQYINTQTGLIKVHAHAEDAAAIPGNGIVLRMMFYAKQRASGASVMPYILRMATEDDYDWENGSGTFMDRRKYYDVGSPGGETVDLWSANVLMSPLSADYGSFITEETPLTLSSAQIEELPQTMSSAIDDTLKPPNKLKVYNYTNYRAPNAISLTLDEGIDDMLVITPADSTGGVRDGDIVRVYDSLESDTPFGEGSLSEGEVRINLGSDNLSPDGGTLYVTNTRGGQTSNRVEFEYPREMSRKVNFKVYSTTMSPSNSGKDIKKDPGLLRVYPEDRITIKVYFEDVNELMAYTFPIHFNSDVVKFADANFNILPSGNLTETDYPDDAVGFLSGTELEPLTVRELLIYYATEDEIDGLLAEMQIDRATFDQIKLRAAEKLERELPWEGGMLYNSAYPYVDNENGLLKVSAISLVPSGLLEQEGGHYFLTLNFLSVSSGIPDFRFANDEDDEYYDPVEPDGGSMHVEGVYTQMKSVGLNDIWRAYWIEGESSTIKLYKGNALRSDITNFGESDGIDENSHFIYSKYKFRDPGFTVFLEDGVVATPEEVAANLKRYYYKDDGSRIELPPYQSGEVLPTDTGQTDGSTAPEGETYFGLLPGDYSRTYKLFYEYTVPDAYDDNGDPIVFTATRKIAMIYKLGDIDRDGDYDDEVTQNDANRLNQHTMGLSELDFSDRLYTFKTGNVDLQSVADEIITQNDANRLNQHAMGVSMFTQEYRTDENHIMSVGS